MNVQTLATVSDVHCKFKRLGACLMYGVHTLGRPGMWPASQSCRSA